MPFFGFDIPEITRKLFFAAFQKEDLEPEEPKELPLSTSSEIIKGYRWWRIQKISGKYRLVSVVYPVIWFPLKPMDDKQSLNSHYVESCYDGVQVDNHAGIHAFNNQNLLNYDENIETLGFYERHCITVVSGEVSLWGKVICCELGYRAQFAYPSKIFIKDSPLIATSLIEASLRNDYGIEVDIV